MRKYTAMTALGTGVAALAIVVGVAATGNAAAGSTSSTSAAKAAPAAATKAGSATQVADQLAAKSVAVDYKATAVKVISTTVSGGDWYQVLLVDADGVNGFAVLVDVKTGATGGIKEVPASTL